MQASKLIQSLVQITTENIKTAELFSKLSDEQLNYKLSQESWSVLECIEHLNRYSDFYIPEIEKQLKKYSFHKSEIFKPGFFGSYFAKSMFPKERLNKMRTFKSMNPINSLLERTVLDKFINQQHQMLKLLKQSQHTNLTKVKTSISITNFIKIRLGDTLRVVVYHNLRHIQQAKRVIQDIL